MSKARLLRPSSLIIFNVASLQALTSEESASLTYMPNSIDARQRPCRPTDEVAVWDNVLPETSLNGLHLAASESGLGHKVFTRPLVDQPENLNLIEKALDAILTEMEGCNGGVMEARPKQFVEYWSRQEWRSIEAHADVDESLAKAQDTAGAGTYRYPVHGHVLYLKVGSEVRGPTCVFPNRRTGGQLLRPVYENSAGIAKTNRSNEVELVTVPAVPGRVLRFEGSALHAVPRPADLWLLSFTEGGSLYDPEDMWGRSVILFNTWNEEPPLDVPIGEQGHGSSSKIFGSVNEHNQLDKYCNPRSEWSAAFELGAARRADQEAKVCEGTEPSQKEQEKELSVSAKIWLLGNMRRRDHQMRNLRLHAPGNLRQALTEPAEVSRILLEHP